MGDFLRKAYDEQESGRFMPPPVKCISNEQYYKELFEMQLEINKRLVNTINSLVDYLGG